MTDECAKLCCCAAAPLKSARVIDASSNLSPDGLSPIQEPVIEETTKQTVCCFWTREIPKSNNSDSQDVWRSTYAVTVRSLPQQGIGLTLDTFDDQRCLVSEISPVGAIAEWNKNCKPSQVVKRGDCVLGVNEHSGTATEISNKIVAEKEKEPRLVLLMKRGKVLNLNLRRSDKPQKSLGLGLDPTSDQLGVRITAVNEEGLIGEWNESSPYPVKPHDRVVSVNGFTSHTDIITLMKESSALNMEILTWVDDTKGKTWVDLTRGCI